MARCDGGSGSILQPDRRFINWKQADAELLLRKLRAWWEEEGKDLLGTPTTSSFFGPLQVELIRQRIEYVLEALRRIIIPRTRAATPLAASVIDLVTEMETRGVPIEPVLPALLHLDRRRQKEISSRLRRGLATHDVRRQRAALSGLASWLRNQDQSPLAIRGYHLPPMPEDLLQELGSIIANRRQPGLLAVLQYAIIILEHFPKRANRRFIDSLTVGLDSLLVETQYRTNDEPAGQVPYEDVPDYRMFAARLANLLTGVRGGRSEVVDRWIETASMDPLPEVREAVSAAADRSR